MRFACAFCLTLALAAGLASAGPINYAEPADLSGDNTTPTALGALDVGANTVSGSISMDFQGQRLSDLADAFSFTLPAGLTITAILISIDGYDGGGSGNQGFANGLGTISFANLFNGDGAFAPTTSDLPATAASPYTFELRGSAELSLSFNWLVTITVTGEQNPRGPTSPSPEPGTLLLAAAGLIALSRKRRRKANRP